MCKRIVKIINRVLWGALHLALIMGFATSTAYAQPGTWTTTFPFGGIIRSAGLALDPSDPNVIYAVPNWRGIYKSSDAGASWNSITDNITLPFDRTGIVFFAIDQNTGAFYVAAWSFGLLRSTDQGENWMHINNGISGHVQVLALDPISPSILYAGTLDAGIFKSVDGGSNWFPSNSGLPSDEIRTIAIDPTQPSTVYLGTLNNGIYKSTDEGQNWLSINNNVDLTRIGDIAIDTEDSNIVYLAGSDSSTGDGIFKSSDGGQNWTKLSLDDGFSYWQPGHFIAIDPVDTNNIYTVSYQSVHKSSDGGENWTSVEVSSVHVISIVIDPTNPQNLYVGTEGEGVFKSTDFGETWVNTSYGIRAINFPHSSAHSLEVDKSDPNFVYAGTINGGYKSMDRGQNWEKMNHPSWKSSTLLTHPSIPGVVYSFRSDLWKSTDYGVTWENLSSESFCCFSLGDLAVAPSNPQILYLGAARSGSSPDGVYKSTDGGSTWTLMDNNGLTNPAIHTITVHPTDPNIVYAGTVAIERDPFGGIIHSKPFYGIYKTTDGGQNWTELTNGLPNVVNPNQISIYASDPDIIYMGSETVNGGVYKSTDAGETWVKILDQNVNTVIVDLNNPDLVYVGTWNTRGFYCSTNGGRTWTQINEGLPINPGIESIAIDPAKRNHLFIGTTGGVYEITFTWIRPRLY